tara:strand:- start:70 stop:1347 length:1278 start_codon:yes stop_codon:yes gene_type:complete
MKYTNYSLGESRYCYGLFRRCKRRRGHVDKQPEVKKEVKKTPVQKPEKKIDVDSIWKRSKEVQGSMNRAKDKFDKLKEKGGEKFKGKFDNAWGEYSGGVDNLKDRYSKIREEIDKLRAGKEGTEEAKKELLHLLGEYDKVIDKLNKASSDLEKPVQDELDRLEKIEKDRLEKIEKDRIEALRNSDVEKPQEVIVDSGQSEEEPEAVAEATAEIGKEAFKEYVSELGHQLDSAKKELVSAIEDDLEARQTRQKSTGGVHLDRMASQSLREAQEALKTVQGGLDNNLAGVDLPQGAWQQSVEGIQGLSARIQVLGRANPEDVVKDLKEKLAKVKATPRPGGTQGRAATKRLDAQEKYLTTILQKPEEYRENLTKQIADKQAEVDKAWIKGGLQKELADLHAESDKAYIVEALNHVLQNSDDSLLANN